MSRKSDIMGVLPDMLGKYNEEKHQAIVETFSDMLDEGFEDDTIKEVFCTGVGFSRTADREIKNQLLGWGIIYDTNH